VFVARAGRSAATPARADEPKYRMVIGKRRNLRRSAALRARVKGRRWDEAASGTPNAREITAANQPPDRRS
jgi:hypothetical protein